MEEEINIVEGNTDDAIYVLVQKRPDSSIYIQIKGQPSKLLKDPYKDPETGATVFESSYGKILNYTGIEPGGPAFFEGEQVKTLKRIDPDVQRKCFDVAKVAHESAFRNRPLASRSLDKGETVTRNHHSLTQDILRAAIKEGLVIPANEETLQYLALSGSAGHDDTPRVLREAAQKTIDDNFDT